MSWDPQHHYRNSSSGSRRDRGPAAGHLLPDNWHATPSSSNRAPVRVRPDWRYLTEETAPESASVPALVLAPQPSLRHTEYPVSVRTTIGEHRRYHQYYRPSYYYPPPSYSPEGEHRHLTRLPERDPGYERQRRIEERRRIERRDFEEDYERYYGRGRSTLIDSSVSSENEDEEEVAEGSADSEDDDSSNSLEPDSSGHSAGSLDKEDLQTSGEEEQSDYFPPPTSPTPVGHLGPYAILPADSAVARPAFLSRGRAANPSPSPICPSPPPVPSVPPPTPARALAPSPSLQPQPQPQPNIEREDNVGEDLRSTTYHQLAHQHERSPDFSFPRCRCARRSRYRYGDWSYRTRDEVYRRPLYDSWRGSWSSRQTSPQFRVDMDRHSGSRRYDDGEVTRYGAGESYRPFNSNRSPPPRRARTPPRERARSPPQLDSDRYVPDRTPRRRSRSVDRYRREPSRDRRDIRDVRDVRDTRDTRDIGGDSWRRRDRSRSLRRSPPRRPSPPPRRSPPRRSPPPRRFSPRRDDRDRARSPRRGFDARFRPPPQTDNPNLIPLTSLPFRRRSRSPPYERDRGRERSPLRRSPALNLRGSTYRGGRSRSPDRRGDDRYVASYNRRPSPPRDSAISSAMPSRDNSRRSSPHPMPPRRDDRRRQEVDDRSRPQSPLPSRPLSRASHNGPIRDRSPQRGSREPSSAPRSPPRGPAALRAPPTGPRESRGYGSQSSGAIGPPARPGPPAPPSRQEMSSPSGAPSGPRGYMPPRGGSYGRGGRGGPSWGNSIQSRNLPPSTGPASAAPTTSPHQIPTGPRASSSSHSVPSTPVSQSKPFNPPKGPAASESNRPSFAQQLYASMPSLIPGGKLDPAYIPQMTGVIPELQAHMAQLKEEEERIRAEKYVKEEKLRKSLREWDRLEREAKVLELRSELSEASLKKLSGEGLGGAAF
ncbi:hypothetical protein F5Y15DRAFT_178434 [Xylariaceae sp. FL0016]|nr:hypothetical protein F5Y15DRAFT_178434 [Xylariaceae sp. FL0016]